MSLSPQAEAGQIINELKNRLTEIKDKIKQGGLNNTVFDELTKNAKAIQSKLDDILRKGGLLSDKDKADAYKFLQEQEKQEMRKRYRKDLFKTVVKIALIAGVFGGIIYYIKKKK
jgi:hypothetical protein